MNKRDSSKRGERVQKVKLPAILEGQTFYRIGSGRHNVRDASVADFDAWADSLCEEIVSVDREVWDVFARWQFINYLIGEDVLVMQGEDGGTILLVETEEKTSADIATDPTSQAS